MSKRIPDVLTASRCIDAICDYLQRHESPLTAADLREAINLIVQSRERKAFIAGGANDNGNRVYIGYDSSDSFEFESFEDYKQSDEYLKEGGE